jgi:alcohol dehydrogenase class IV
MVAIPTTAGSGTEVAPRFLIRDPETDVKRRYGGEDCYARVALLDPLLLVSLPPRTAIGASLDALCHAIEAYLSTDANLITDALALSAIEMLGKNMGRAALTADVQAKEATLVASTMANMACGNAKLGLVHGLTYGHMGLPHGMANGVMLPYVLEYLLPACEERLARIGEALGAPRTGRSAADAAAAIEAIRELYRRMEAPRSLAESGVGEDDLAELVEIAMKQTQHLNFSPRPVRRGDVERIFRRALAGWS